MTCFTPTTDCTVRFECAAGDMFGMAINVIAGACNTTVASCVAGSAFNDPESVDVGLSGGTEYCGVCSSALGGAAVTLTLTEQGGTSCGTVPVTLQTFSIEQ